ncbi:unnamed protein product [Arabidopsis halleri]
MDSFLSQYSEVKTLKFLDLPLRFTVLLAYDRRGLHSCCFFVDLISNQAFQGRAEVFVDFSFSFFISSSPF